MIISGVTMPSFEEYFAMISIIVNASLPKKQKAQELANGMDVRNTALEQLDNKVKEA